MAHRIAVMPGDGIGPEVVAVGVSVLEHLADQDGIEFDLVHLPHSASHYRATGVDMDGETLELIGTCRAVLFGAAGDEDLPGVMERALVMSVVRAFDLSIITRSARLHHERLSPFKDSGERPVDCMIVRPAVGGELAIPGGSVHVGTVAEVAASVHLHTRADVGGTLRHGFELARERRGRLSVVAQSNAMVEHEIWSRIAREIADDYPQVELELLLPDHAAMRFITHAGEYDVVATTLLIGGILTDLAAAAVGGIGLVGSARFNPKTGFGFFEPAHGSAPRHAGRGVASPLATLDAIGMMLRSLGEGTSADRLDAAVHDVIASGDLPDPSTRSGVGTREQGDLVKARLDLSA